MPTDQKSSTWYEENAKEYASHTRNPKDSVYHAYYEKPAMYSLLPDLNGKTVLSIGCGSGEDSKHLKDQGAIKSVGIDLSKGLIKIASETYTDCEFHVMDMEKLDFPDEIFDLAYSSLAIHYLENWDIALKEIYKVLKPNSYFIFSCHHPMVYGMEKSETDTQYISQYKISKEKTTKAVEIHGDYLTKRKINDALGPNTVNTWNLSINDISADIAKAGFLIERIVEPKPLPELENINLNTYNKLNKIPYFIIFKLLKTNFPTEEFNPKTRKRIGETIKDIKNNKNISPRFSSTKEAIEHLKK